MNYESIFKALNDAIYSKDNLIEYLREDNSTATKKLNEANSKINELENELEQAESIIRCLKERVAELETEWKGDEASTESAGDF